MLISLSITLLTVILMLGYIQIYAPNSKNPILPNSCVEEGVLHIFDLTTPKNPAPMLRKTRSVIVEGVTFEVKYTVQEAYKSTDFDMPDTPLEVFVDSITLPLPFGDVELSAVLSEDVIDKIDNMLYELHGE